MAQRYYFYPIFTNYVKYFFSTPNKKYELSLYNTRTKAI